MGWGRSRNRNENNHAAQRKQPTKQTFLDCRPKEFERHNLNLMPVPERLRQRKKDRSSSNILKRLIKANKYAFTLSITADTTWACMTIDRNNYVRTAILNPGRTKSG
ncbi:hypothetical protein CHS0354_036007, partial [Potamilus streckersoni]